MNVLILSNTPRVLILSLLSPQSPVLLLTVSMNHEPTLQALKTILIHSSGGSHRVRFWMERSTLETDGLLTMVSTGYVILNQVSYYLSCELFYFQ